MSANDFDNDLPDLSDDLKDAIDETEFDENGNPIENDEDYGTYQDPDFDPDDDDEEENEYEFLYDPQEIDNLSMAEVENYANEIDPSELNEDQEEGYQLLMERDAQIKQDKMSLTRFKQDIAKEMQRILALKTKYPEAKKRLPQLKTEQKKSPKQMQQKLKSYAIQEEEIQKLATKEIKQVKALIKAEIVIATAQLAAEVVKDVVKKIPFPWNVAALASIAAVLLRIIMFAIMIIIILSIAGSVNQNIDMDNGQIATSAGMSGDKFYGARYIYYDDEKAVQELESNYQNLVVDLVTRIDEINGIDATVELTWTEERPEKLTQMIKVVADQTDNSDQAFDTLAEHLAIIDHFGYTDVELNNIQSALLEYILSNNVFDIDTEVFTSNFNDEFNTIFDTNYDDLNVTAPLYFVQDVILENEDDMLKNMPEKNYVAMIIMPKEDVTIAEMNFMFYIQDPSTQVKVEFVSNNSGAEIILATDTADSTWWDEDNSSQETTIVTNINLSPFASIDISNEQLKNGASIYSIICQDLAINQAKINQLFSLQDIEGYSTVGYLPNGDQNCYYLRFESNVVFQFCEYYTEY